MSNTIYLDNAATTQIDERVWMAMIPYLEGRYGNPSSVYSFSRENKSALKKVRDGASKLLHAKPQEIYFTSGGTEAINWALKGIAFAPGVKGKHIVSSKTEHHSTLHTLDFLVKLGFHVTYLEVDDQGFINLEELRNSIREDTILVSLMAANNETGTINDLRAIGEICQERQVLFHTDAVQAVGAMDINVSDMHIDLLSASAHKFHGPKGAGFLYVRSGIPIENLVHGGNQERGRRSESHVLKAMGVEKDFIKGSLRLTLSKYTSQEEIEQVIRIIKDTVISLRN